MTNRKDILTGIENQLDAQVNDRINGLTRTDIQKQAIKRRVVGTINAIYQVKGLKKTISEEDWTKIVEPCSEVEANEYATAICADYQIDKPTNAKELAVKGLDAVADFIANANTRDFDNGGEPFVLPQIGL